MKADVAGADLLLVGTICPSQSHPGTAATGVGLLEQLRQRVGTPYLAIGGMNVTNADSAICSGAAGVAVITAITQSNDPTHASEELVAVIRRAWASFVGEKAGRTA
jgi:thiamine monophosphate synthase